MHGQADTDTQHSAIGTLHSRIHCKIVRYEAMAATETAVRRNAMPINPQWLFIFIFRVHFDKTGADKNAIIFPLLFFVASSSSPPLLPLLRLLLLRRRRLRRRSCCCCLFLFFSHMQIRMECELLYYIWTNDTSCLLVYSTITDFNQKIYFGCQITIAIHFKCVFVWHFNFQCENIVFFVSRKFFFCWSFLLFCHRHLFFQCTQVAVVPHHTTHTHWYQLRLLVHVVSTTDAHDECSSTALTHSHTPSHTILDIIDFVQ